MRPLSCNQYSTKVWQDRLTVDWQLTDSGGDSTCFLLRRRFDSLLTFRSRQSKMVVICISHAYSWNEKNEGKKERKKKRKNTCDVDLSALTWPMTCPLDLFCPDFWLMAATSNHFFRWVWHRKKKSEINVKINVMFTFTVKLIMAVQYTV